MLKTIPFLLETMQCPINKPQRRFILVLETGKTKMTKIFKNLKNSNFVKKEIAKNCDIEKLIIQPLMRFSGPWYSKNLINDYK